MKMLLDAATIESRIRELAQEIEQDYPAEEEIHLVCVLKGGFMFMADLVRALTIPCEIDFMAVSSYGNATDSSGVVRILKDLDANIECRYVGFEIPDRFAIGYGLDYAERLRNLPYVAALDESRLDDPPT